MRIVIDLQCCQMAHQPDALQLARALAAISAPHECWIALSNRFPAAIEALRVQLADVVPRQRIRVCSMPLSERRHPSPWLNHAGERIRANFVAALGADVLLLPAPDSTAESHPDDPFVIVRALEGETAGALLARLLERAAQHVAPAVAPRPRLAYISPLPPEHSGIADYSAELAPQLAQYYDIALVSDQAQMSDPRLATYPVRSVAWFEAHAQQFDRVLYHFGNSHAHQHMFALIRQHPGTVVLHDFYLSGILDNLEREQVLPSGFLDALYESHGYTGLLEHRELGRNAAIWKFPVNKGVLDNANGVIVHSAFSGALAGEWYGERAAAHWATVPLLRGKRPGAQDAGARAAARARLGLEENAYLVCSFGMLGATKLNEELLDAVLDSPLAADPRCKLVFVGQNESGLYGAALQRKIAASSAAASVAITGFASAEAYTDYLLACDCAVQLRKDTRGETSAAILDCLLYGVPTIVNAHGSAAALDPQMVLMLPDRFSAPELRDGLARLFSERTHAAALSQRAAAYMQAEHAPATVGARFRDAIEHFHASAPRAHYQRLLGQLAQSPASVPTAAELSAAACAIAANQPHAGPRQMLVDVSALVTSDLKTGIQRVVRSVLLALIAEPPPGWRIEPVFSTGSNRPYHYARRFTLDFIGETGLVLEDAPVDLHPDDMFLGLDLFTNGTSQNAALLQSMRDFGIEIYFVVFDILPLLRPDAFPFGTEQHFGDYLRTITRVADGLLCISRSVADELIAWIAANGSPRVAPLRVGYFHLGADITASAPSHGLPDNAAQVLAAVAAQPSLLMVGTVEPRKGHAQALDAFELLWQRGVEIHLVIVGKQGWMVDALAARLAAHPELGRRLFWLPGVSDEMLLKLYTSCAALLAASEGEGFGLPLIEAAQHQIPIIARELPVFREVAGSHAYYFSGSGAADLADSIAAWLALARAGAAPASAGMPWLTWKQSARQVLNAVHRQEWYKQLPGNGSQVA